MRTLYKEINITDNSKLIMFQNYDFWDKTINEYVGLCDNVTIVSYNFNFQHRGKGSFFQTLISLLNKGCRVRLIYAKSIGDESVNAFINKYGFIAKCTDNHSKMFLSKKFAYIGSSNFSLGSNKNIENGFITTGKKIITEINNFTIEIFNSTVFQFQVTPEIYPLVHDEIKKIDKIIMHISDFYKKLNSSDLKYNEIDDCISCILYEVTNLAKYNGLYKEYEMEESLSLLENEYEDHLLVPLLEEYKEQIFYVLSRGGALRLYYENGEIDDIDSLFSSCAPNELESDNN